MNIIVQYLKMPSSEAMTELVSKKLNKLAEKYDWVIKAQVLFKQENDPSGEGKICEITLSLPGPNIFAINNAHNFELAAANAINELEKQLKKRKELNFSH